MSWRSEHAVPDTTRAWRVDRISYAEYRIRNLKAKYIPPSNRVKLARNLLKIENAYATLGYWKTCPDHVVEASRINSLNNRGGKR